jgi:Flp pilus assembly protein TadG
VSVEVALLAPVLLILLVGGVHFGLVLKTKHRLTDAANYAVRAAVIARTSNATQIRNFMLNRMGDARTDCTSLGVTVTTTTDAVNLTRLEMTATCQLAATFGGNFLGAIGPSSLTVSAGMPL